VVALIHRRHNVITDTDGDTDGGTVRVSRGRFEVAKSLWGSSGNSG
jgi:hypothetical protein